MALRDPAEYREASKGADVESIDRLPDVIAEIIAEQWDGRLPTRETFVKTAARLTGLCLHTLLVDGRLAALLGDMARKGSDQDRAEWILAEVLAAANPLLVAQCCDIAFDYKLQPGKTETDIGKEHGLTKATVSAICTSLKETYTGKPGTGMKSNAAVEKYAQIREGRRAKPLPQEWAFAERFKNLLHGTKRTKRR